jgi:hypothetical protein
MGGMSAERAADWIARWAAQAASEGRPRDGAYWDAGYRWIEAARQGAEDPTDRHITFGTIAGP